ncbi:MAG TPA: UPF0175 family protein [Prolixibacteraceae bacterium]|nr:UPF0175 family protein [Prolixibacteraceae bacterium]
MKKIVLQIPDNIDISENETKRFLAAKLFEAGKLSLGQAAELAGMTKLTFSELLADYDVSLINYSSLDIARDASQL